MAPDCRRSHIRSVESTTQDAPPVAAPAPIEIGRRPLRLLILLFVATFGVVIVLAVVAGAAQLPWLTESNLFLVFFLALALLTLALACAPAIVFLAHIRSHASITPRLTRSALASAIAPLCIGVWLASNAGAPGVLLGLPLILLAGAVIMSVFNAARADTSEESHVLKPGASLVALALLTLGMMSVPHEPSRDKHRVTTVKSDLRGLAYAQESYFDSTKRYHADPAVLGFRPTPGVDTPTISVTGSGWSATTAHSQLKGVRCAIAVGTTNPVSTTALDGVPACTDNAPKR